MAPRAPPPSPNPLLGPQVLSSRHSWLWRWRGSSLALVRDPPLTLPAHPVTLSILPPLLLLHPSPLRLASNQSTRPNPQPLRTFQIPCARGLPPWRPPPPAATGPPPRVEAPSGRCSTATTTSCRATSSTSAGTSSGGSSMRWRTKASASRAVSPLDSTNLWRGVVVLESRLATI